MNKNKNLIKKIAQIVCLIVIASLWRILNFKYQLAPNLELVTTVTIVAALTIGFRAAIIVPITTMALTDVIIGNSSIFIFTWGAFALIGASAMLLKKLNNQPKLQIFSSFGFVIASSFLFFAITNFGVWLQGWYPATLSGLMDSYIMAIPFYRTMLIGNLIIIPTVVASLQLIKARQTNKSLVINTLIS